MYFRAKDPTMDMAISPLQIKGVEFEAGESGDNGGTALESSGESDAGKAATVDNPKTNEDDESDDDSESEDEDEEPIKKQTRLGQSVNQPTRLIDQTDQSQRTLLQNHEGAT